MLFIFKLAIVIIILSIRTDILYICMYYLYANVFKQRIQVTFSIVSLTPVISVGLPKNGCKGDYVIKQRNQIMSTHKQKQTLDLKASTWIHCSISFAYNCNNSFNFYYAFQFPMHQCLVDNLPTMITPCPSGLVMMYCSPQHPTYQ